MPQGDAAGLPRHAEGVRRLPPARLRRGPDHSHRPTTCRSATRPRPGSRRFLATTRRTSRLAPATVPDARDEAGRVRRRFLPLRILRAKRRRGLRPSTKSVLRRRAEGAAPNVRKSQWDSPARRSAAGDRSWRTFTDAHAVGSGRGRCTWRGGRIRATSTVPETASFRTIERTRDKRGHWRPGRAPRIGQSRRRQKQTQAPRAVIVFFMDSRERIAHAAA